MGIWKDNAKSDSVKPEGPAARDSGKAPFPGVVSGNVENQMNPRRQRRENFTALVQPHAHIPLHRFGHELVHEFERDTNISGALRVWAITVLTNHVHFPRHIHIEFVVVVRASVAAVYHQRKAQHVAKVLKFLHEVHEIRLQNRQHQTIFVPTPAAQFRHREVARVNTHPLLQYLPPGTLIIGLWIRQAH